MSTVNFSVPETVKQAFNRTFADQNKSAVIARLMEQAIADEQEQALRQARREAAFRRLTEGRAERPAGTDEELRSLRDEMRS
jgi:hypothetical protein